jgi:hypothetical protein
VSIANSLARLLLLRRSGERSLEIFFRSRLVRIVLKQRDFASFGRMGVARKIERAGETAGLPFSVHVHMMAVVGRRAMGKAREPRIVAEPPMRWPERTKLLSERGGGENVTAQSRGWQIARRGRCSGCS